MRKPVSNGNGRDGATSNLKDTQYIPQVRQGAQGAQGARSASNIGYVAQQQQSYQRNKMIAQAKASARRHGFIQYPLLPPVEIGDLKDGFVQDGAMDDVIEEVRHQHRMQTILLMGIIAALIVGWGITSATAINNRHMVNVQKTRVVKVDKGTSEREKNLQKQLDEANKKVEQLLSEKNQQPKDTQGNRSEKTPENGGNENGSPQTSNENPNNSSDKGIRGWFNGIKDKVTGGTDNSTNSDPNAQGSPSSNDGANPEPDQQTKHWWEKIEEFFSSLGK